MLKLTKEACAQSIVIDCETSTAVAHVHSTGKQFVGSHQIVQDKKVICVSYMQLDWKKPKTIQWDKNQDDRKLLIELGKVMNQYQVVVGQNSDNFDLKVLQGRAFLQQVQPLPKMLTLDTLKMSRQNMKLISHKLDFVSKSLGMGGKNSTSFQLWLDVYNKDAKALKDMIDYCEKDVIDTRDYLLKLLPYCNNLPYSLSVLSHGHKDGCPKCGHLEKVQNRIMKTLSGEKVQWRCRNCSGYWTDHRRLKA